MIVYGVSNVGEDGCYNNIQQLAFNPKELDFLLQGYIIWYTDFEGEVLELDFSNRISDFFKFGWKIWECNARIFNCTYRNGIIYSYGRGEVGCYDGVLEIEYKEGDLKDFKFWNTEKDYFENKTPNVVCK